MRYAMERNSLEEPWLKSANFLLKLQLEGLMVECPVCNSLGIPMKKYVKGKKNPIFIIHQNSSNLLQLCPLEKLEIEIIKKQVKITENDLEIIFSSATPFIMFSGGFDSLCTLLYSKAIAQKTHTKIKAIHVDTTVGITGSLEHVKEVCKELEIELIIVKPKVDFFTLAEKWGIPSHGYRWCCRELKIKPLSEYFKTITETKVVLDGIRAAESSIRASYLPIWHHPSFGCISISPIFRWSDEEVQKFVSDYELPIDILKGLNTSPECWCGAYKTESDFRELHNACPELYNKLAELERRNGGHFTFIYENGQKKSLYQLKSDILKKY